MAAPSSSHKRRMSDGQATLELRPPPLKIARWRDLAESSGPDTLGSGSGSGTDLGWSGSSSMTPDTSVTPAPVSRSSVVVGPAPGTEITDEDRQAAYQFVQRFYAALATLNADYWVKSFFAPDASLRFTDDKPVVGHDELVTAASGEFALLHWLRHEAHTIDVLPTKTLAMGRARYGPKLVGSLDAAPIVVRTTLVFHRAPQDQLISGLDVYGDFEQVRLRFAQVQRALSAG